MLDEDLLAERERRGGRYGDAYRDRYHRDDRHHRRDRSRDREDRYRSDRHRGDRYDRDYERSRGSSRRDRSKSRERRRRSRSKESRHRDRSRDRSRERSHRDRSRDKERSKRDLSVEIEQELQNLRKLSDMKAALAKAKNQVKQMSDTEEAERRKDKIEYSQLFKPTEKQQKKDDFISQISNDSSSKPTEYVPEIQTEEERIEFQKKMQEKLQAHLAAEGKLYPKPKPGPAINPATGFANDGSFLEMFKQMQQQTAALAMMQPVATSSAITPEEPAAVPYYMAAAATVPVTSAPTFTQTVKEPVPIPIVGRRRGGKILKTGIVKKPKPIEDATVDAPNDAWNLYLQEVKKYKNASCDADSKTRPLVK